MLGRIPGPRRAGRVSLAAQRAPVALRGRRRRRVVAVVLARAPVVAVTTVRPVAVSLAHVAARQEMRNLMQALGLEDVSLPALDAAA